MESKKVFSALKRNLNEEISREKRENSKEESASGKGVSPP